MIKTNQNVFFSLLKGFLMKKLLSRQQKKNDSIFKSYNFNETVCLVTYITDRNGRKTDRDELKVTVSLLF